MNTQQSEHVAAANLSGETARKEFKSAVLTSVVFGAATLLAYEAAENLLPEGPFREAAANTVLTLGSIVTGVTAAAGSATAAMMKYEEVKHLRAEISFRQNEE